MALRSAAAPILLACVLGLALAWPLHAPPIEHHGEAREGLVVQAVVDRGEWILPRRNGELPSKPPLFHWLAAAATRAFGFSDGVVRLPSAVAAWGVACVTFALGGAIGLRHQVELAFELIGDAALEISGEERTGFLFAFQFLLNVARETRPRPERHAACHSRSARSRR